MSARILFIVAIVGLSGCVAGQNIRLRYEPSRDAAAASASMPTKVIVTDNREYVVSGDKRPEYIGHYRAGFGNTWDVVNFKQVSLANQFAMDIESELKSLGFAVNDSQFRKVVTVAIREWNFDAMTNGRFWYDIQLTVSVPDGTKLFDTHVQDEKTVQGSVMTGAKSAMEKEIPVLYGQIIRALIRDNQGTMAALRK